MWLLMQNSFFLKLSDVISLVVGSARSRNPPQSSDTKASTSSFSAITGSKSCVAVAQSGGLAPLLSQATKNYEKAVQLNWNSPQELSAIVPVREKQAIVKTAVNKYGLAEDTSRTGGSVNVKEVSSNELFSPSAIYIAVAHALKPTYSHLFGARLRTFDLSVQVGSKLACLVMIRDLFDCYSENGIMTVDHLHRFLIEVEGEDKATKEDTELIMESLNELKHLNIFHRKGLHLEAFFHYLFCDSNPPLSPSPKYIGFWRGFEKKLEMIGVQKEFINHSDWEQTRRLTLGINLCIECKSEAKLGLCTSSHVFYHCDERLIGPTMNLVTNLNSTGTLYGVNTTIVDFGFVRKEEEKEETPVAFECCGDAVENVSRPCC
ncbi:unnamed protein product [Camellia sinensis]